MSASDIAAACFVIAVLAAASVWLVVKITGRFAAGAGWVKAPWPANEHQQWQQARQDSMQAVRDHWTCKQILQLPESTESND